VLKVACVSTGSGFAPMLQDIIFIEIKPLKEYRRELNGLVITSILPSSRANPDELGTRERYSEKTFAIPFEPIKPYTNTL
jgi:hypothetical protein